MKQVTKTQGAKYIKYIHFNKIKEYNSSKYLIRIFQLNLYGKSMEKNKNENK